MSADRRVISDPEALQRWRVLGLQIHTCDWVLRHQGPPTAESELAAINEQFPAWHVSTTLQHLVWAAGEHLMQWADAVAPLGGQVDEPRALRTRPVYSWARSAMEAAGTAAWIAEPAVAEELLKRHLVLLYHDLREQRAAHAVGGTWAAVALLDQHMRALVDDRFAGVQPKSVRYLDRVRAGARLAGEDEDRCEYLWRVASAASHGQQWFGAEAYERGSDDATAGVWPDEQRRIEVLEAAYALFHVATTEYVRLSGGDVGLAH
jgi:hypothetical protein